MVKGEVYLNKKFSNLIGWVVICFCVALFTLAWNWYWVKNDPPTQGLIFGLLFSFLGAVVGGMTSGYGSYLGGVQGAKENYELMKKMDVDSARKKLYRQLHLTWKLVNAIKNPPNEKLEKMKEIYGAYILYDTEWPKHVSLIEDLTDSDVEKIVLWFHQIVEIETRCARVETGKMEAWVLAESFEDGDLDNIKKILEKLVQS